MTSDSLDLHDATYHVAMEAGDSDVLEIERWCCRLRQENTDLQDALGKADVEIHKLSQEIVSLREKNKSLQKEMCQFVDLQEQVKNLTFKVKQNKDAADMENQPKEDKKRRCLQKISTVERADQLVSQLDRCHDETVVLKKEVNRLRNQTTNLEKELQNRRLELKKKQELAEEKESIRTCMTITLNEYASTREVLNNQICTLQSQVEEMSQECFLRTMEESSKITEYPPDDDTLMYEILKAKLDEERLRWTDEQKKWGFLRLLYTMMLKVLWCNFKVAFFFGFFVLFFHYLLQLHQSQDKRWYIQSVFSSETIEWIKHIWQSFPQLITLGEMPHKITF